MKTDTKRCRLSAFHLAKFANFRAILKALIQQASATLRIILLSDYENMVSIRNVPLKWRQSKLLLRCGPGDFEFPLWRLEALPVFSAKARLT